MIGDRLVILQQENYCYTNQCDHCPDDGTRCNRFFKKIVANWNQDDRLKGHQGAGYSNLGMLNGQ